MVNVFVSRSDLKLAVNAWIDGKAAEYGSISSWDVSRVNDFSSLFGLATSSTINGDIGRWDTSRVTNMRETLDGK